MYIEPNSRFILLKGCPLDNTYTHTIWFEDKTAQFDYFYSLKKHELTKQSYQRYKRGVMRIEVPTDRLYDCNYLMFQNTSYGDKWFYAFILGVEYINNKTSEIVYQIDVMQTWYFDYHFTGCYVEREHTATDIIGENIYPENFETGEYIIATQASLSVMSDMDIVVASTVDYLNHESGEIGNVVGAMYSGIYSGVIYKRFRNDVAGAKECSQFLLDVTNAGKSDGIVSVFMMPSMFTYDIHTGVDNTKTYDLTLNKLYNNIDGYVPRNKKMFTYPYNVLSITNNMGTVANYKYEDFFGDNPNEIEFKMVGDMSQNPSIYLVPKNYKIRQLEDNTDEILNKTYNFEEKITITGYPLLPFNVDLYKAWEAQNLNVWNAQNNAMNTSVASGALSKIVGGAMSGAMGGAQNEATMTFANGKTVGLGMPDPTSTGVGALSGASMGMFNSGISFLNHYETMKARNAEIEAKALMPPQAHNVGHSTTLCAFDKMKFEIYYKQIKRDFAILLDQFWDMFGYPIHKIKIPNTNVRPHWTYTKTIYCHIVGDNMCSDDISAISQIYNNGITFWNNGNEVGQYGLNNSV